MSRGFRILSLLLIVTFVAAACAAPTATPAAQPTTPSQPPPEGVIALPNPALKDYQGTITFYTWESLDTTNNTDILTQAKFMKEWASYYPGLTLNLESIPGGQEQYAWALAQFQAGAPPDSMTMFPVSTSSPTEHPDWWLSFDDYLAQKNPYSTNATWLDDFPFEAAALRAFDATTGGKTYAIGANVLGTKTTDAYYYNQTMLDAAGVATDPATWTWTDFVDAMEKLKAAGYVPWYEQTIGDNSYLTDWAWWIVATQTMAPFADPLDGIIPEGLDVGATTANYADNVELAYAVQKGLFDLDSEEFTRCLTDQFRLRQQWYSYTQPGFLAPSPKGEDFFRDGQAAMRQGGIWDSETLFNVSQEAGWEMGSWGGLPRITDDVTPCHRNSEPYSFRLGGGSAVGTGAPVMIPQVTMDNAPEKVAMLVDFLQWYTAPTQQERYCKEAGAPFCSQPNAPASEIYADNPAKGLAMRGHYEPPWYWPSSPVGDSFPGTGETWGNAAVLDFSNAITDGRKRIETDLWGGNITLEQAVQQYKDLFRRELPDVLRANPAWNADTW